MAEGSGADLYSFYRRALRKAWEDGRITSDERGLLSELSPGIEPENVDRLEAREYFRHRWKEYAGSSPELRLSILDSASEFDPENEFLWSERCAALYQLGRLEDAMGSADRCLTLSSGSSDAWFWKGSILARRGSLQDAAECLEDSLEIDPDNEIAWIMLGWTERARGDHSKAKACYDRIIDLCPDLPIGHIERGLTFIKAGDLESAHTDLQRALELDPGNQRAADLLRSMGADLPTEGEDVFEEAIECAPSEPREHGHADEKDDAIKPPQRKVRIMIDEDDLVPEVPEVRPGSEADGLGGDVQAKGPAPPPPAPRAEQSGPGQEIVHKWMRCPHCGDNIPLTTMERPLVITCKSCGAKGKLVK